MQQGPPRRRRARPVGDLPIAELVPRAEELTKGWLLAILEQTPLDEVSGVVTADLARDGPRICVAVLRALADDADLQRLSPAGALEPLASRTGALAGASTPDAVSQAVDALGA